MQDPEDEVLIQEMLPVLDVDHHHMRLVEAWNRDRVAQIRRCGRQAGKRLGYKIRTVASDPDQRDDGRLVVWSSLSTPPPTTMTACDNEANS